MAEAALKLPEKPATKPAAPTEMAAARSAASRGRSAVQGFRLALAPRAVRPGRCRLEPFWRGEIAWGKMPAADFVDNEKSYVVTAELPGMCGSGRRRQIRRRDADDPRREERGKGREEEGLLSRRAALRLVPTGVPGAQRRRRRQDRGGLQERRSHRDHAEDGRSREEREEDRNQEGLNRRGSQRFLDLKSRLSRLFCLCVFLLFRQTVLDPSHDVPAARWLSFVLPYA